VNLALLTTDHTRDNVALKKPIPAGKSQIFRYQTLVSVVDEVQIVRAAHSPDRNMPVFATVRHFEFCS
jgi:hypothetical protein